jgi:glyoxylase-like metal-dependent hydrolase (beta-lactamase superfamily II)
MTEFTRRKVLAGGAATAALSLGLMPSGLRAAAPAAGKQAPGFYRYKIGDVEVTVVTDGVVRMKLPETFVSNVKVDEVKAALADAHMSTDIFNNTFTPVVLNTAGKLVLIDTGVGEGGFNATKGTAGQFLNNFAAAGLKPEMIDTVVISHYHGDHMNGLIRADGSITFPNAEILVPAKEHAFWMDDGEMARAAPGRMEELFKNNRRVFAGEVLKRLRTYEWDKEVVPGLLAVGTPGHSAGHTSHVLSSGSAKVYIQADVTHVPYLFARHPGWHAFYDQIPDMAEATRRKVYDMLAAEKMMVQGFHYPFPALAYVEKTASGYHETMVPWNAAI